MSWRTQDWDIRTCNCVWGSRKWKQQNWWVLPQGFTGDGIFLSYKPLSIIERLSDNRRSVLHGLLLWKDATEQRERPIKLHRPSQVVFERWAYPTLIVVQARVQFMAWTWDAICVKDAIVVTVSVPINPNYDTLLDGRKKRNKRFDSNFPIVWALIRLHSW